MATILHQPATSDVATVLPPLARCVRSAPRTRVAVKRSLPRPSPACGAKSRNSCDPPGATPLPSSHPIQDSTLTDRIWQSSPNLEFVRLLRSPHRSVEVKNQVTHSCKSLSKHGANANPIDINTTSRSCLGSPGTTSTTNLPQVDSTVAVIAPHEFAQRSTPIIWKRRSHSLPAAEPTRTGKLRALTDH
jgi:hypothetical protein